MKINCILILLSFAFAGKSHIPGINNSINTGYQQDSVELLSHHWNFIAFSVNGNETPVDEAHPGFVEIRKSGDVIMKRFGNTTTYKWSFLPGKMLWTLVTPDKTKETAEWMIVALNNNSLKISAKVDGAEIMMSMNR